MLFFSALATALLSLPLVARAELSALETYVDVLDLSYSFNPVKPAYWTNLPRHRRTPFSISPDGSTAFLAYLDNSETDVHVIEIDPTTFTAKGTPVTVTGGKEAGGLVAQNDGFALLTNVAVTGTNAPPSGTPVPVIVRYTNGAETWRTFVAGPGVHEADGLSMAPDMNGDLVYSEAADLYGAYFVVTDYTGDAEGHFGDSIEYVSSSGTLETITGASSSWGCSHNTGIAFEAADEAPFASICAEDHGSIWLNTATRSMDGKKISGENVTNGASGEPMGGMSGSYSSLALFPGGTEYIFAWRTRGCVDLTQDTWMGDGYTQCSERYTNGQVAISLMTDKETMAGSEAISTVGATDGDAQINWITKTTADHSNVHAATFDSANALITWEEIATPTCELYAFGCYGTFSGAYYQLVSSTGEQLGDPISSTNTYVAGDIVNIGDKLCWPYVSMDWDLSLPVDGGLPVTSTTKMSFACIGNGGNSTTTTTTSTVASSSSSALVATSSVKSTSLSTAAAVQSPSSASSIESTSLSTAPAVQPTTSIPSVSSTPTPSPSSLSSSSFSSISSAEPTTTTHTSTTTTITSTVYSSSSSASSASSVYSSSSSSSPPTTLQTLTTTTSTTPSSSTSTSTSSSASVATSTSTPDTTSSESTLIMEILTALAAFLKYLSSSSSST